MGVGLGNELEKEQLLPQHSLEPLRADSRPRPRSKKLGLKTAIVCTAVYGVYWLTAATFNWATWTPGAALSRSDSDVGAGLGRWALDAFVKHDAYRAGDLSGEKAEELYL